MKSFIKFVLVFGGILAVSAVLAPLLYTFLPYKFERIFNRLVMIMSLAALWFLLIGKRFDASAYGIAWIRGVSLSQFFLGLSVALSVLVVFSIVKISVGQAALREPDLISLLAKLGAAFGAGLLIAVIEEFFFRGFIFKTLCKWRWPIMLAVIGTSAFYAVVHFVSFEKPFVDSTPTIIDGFRLVAAPFMSILQIQRYWPEALGLFLFGLVLNMAAMQSGSLYPSIGVHAGCVLYVKADDLLLTFYEKQRLLYASGKFYDGLLGWFFIGFIGFIMFILIFKFNKNHKKLGG